MWYGLAVGAILLALPITMVSAATYVDPMGRFSVTIPNGWQPDQDAKPFDLSYGAPGKRKAGFGVIASDDPVPGDSANLVMNIIGLLGDTFDEPNAFSTQLTTLGGQPAQRADGRGHISGVALRLTIVAAVVSGTTYVLVFVAREAEYPAVANEAQAIFDSFAFLNVPVVAPAPTTSVLPPAIIRRLGDG